MQDSMYAVRLAMGIPAQIPLIPRETILTALFPVINIVNGVSVTDTHRLMETIAATEVR